MALESGLGVTKIDNFSGELIAFLATSLFIYYLSSRAFRFGLVDKPSNRKSHEDEIPAIGGIAIFGGFLLTLLTSPFFQFYFEGFLLPAFLLVSVGAFDDLISLSHKSRFIVQILAGLLMTVYGGIVLYDFGALFLAQKVINLGVLSVPITIVCLVGVVNAFNMSDGIDGLVGSLTLVALLNLGIVAYIGGQLSFVHVISFLGFCTLAFLTFNARYLWRRKAVIFLGDSGSTFLGFVVVWFSVSLSQGEHAAMTPVTPLWFVALPLFDLTTVMIRRINREQSPFQADREHLHHLFLSVGFSVGQTVLILMVVASLLSMIGIVGLYMDLPENVMFYFFLGIFGLYYFWVRRAWMTMRFLGRPICRRQTRRDRRSGQDRRSQLGLVDLKMYEGANRRRGLDRREIVDRRTLGDQANQLRLRTGQASIQVDKTESRPKIIFINRFFWPDHSATSQLLCDLAFAMSAQGRSVSVVTSRQLYGEPFARLPSEEAVKGVKIVRVWTSYFGRQGLFGRGIDYLTFYIGALWRIWRGVSRGDFIVAMTDPPLINVPVMVIASIREAKLINWHQDVFPEVASAVGVKVIRGRISDTLARVRNASVRNAYANIVLSRNMAQCLTSQCVTKEHSVVENIKIIPNWSDGCVIHPKAHKDNSFRSVWGLQDRFVVGYSGNMGRVHEFGTLLDAAERLLDFPDIVFLFIGGGYYRAWIENEAQRKGLSNIMFQPYQPRERLIDSLGVPDVHLISLRKEIEGLVFPSKLYGILAAGRPSVFVGAEEGDVAQILRSESCGLVVSEGDAQGCVEGIKRLRGDPALRHAMGVRARDLFERHYDINTALSSWYDILSPFYSTEGAYQKNNIERDSLVIRKRAS